MIERYNSSGQLEFTGHKQKRLILVLDCLVPHDFSDKTIDFVNLQHYVIKEKKLTEKEAVVIFFDIVRVVESLHSVRLISASLDWLERHLFKYIIRVIFTSLLHPGDRNELIYCHSRFQLLTLYSYFTEKYCS